MALGALTQFGISQAALVDHGSFTVDTVTNLQWLDVDLSRGLSFDQILGGAGGWATAGYRYATTQEVVSLLTAYVNPQEGLSQTGHYSEASEFVSLFGATAVFPAFGVERIYAMYDDQTDNGSVGRADIFVTTTGIGSGVGSWEASDNYQTTWFGIESIGSFLVTVSTVPEPATYTILLAGLGGLGVVNRRRQKKQRAAKAPNFS